MALLLPAAAETKTITNYNMQKKKKKKDSQFGRPKQRTAVFPV